jgi:hypothetical protein
MNGRGRKFEDDNQEREFRAGTTQPSFSDSGK